MKQLNLLSWTPPCQVIPFPASKRLGKIRRVADVLSTKHGKAADTYWRQTVTTMIAQFERAGLSQDTIRTEVRAFHDAVQAELTRRAWARQGGQRPGGDAA